MDLTHRKLVVVHEYRKFIYESMYCSDGFIDFKNFSWLLTNNKLTELYESADLDMFLDEFMGLEKLSQFKELIDFYSDLQSRLSLFSSKSDKSLSTAVLPYLSGAVGSKIYNLKIGSLNHYLIVDLNKYVTVELEALHQLKNSENSNLIHNMTEFYSSNLKKK